MTECPNAMQQEHIKEIATLRSEVNELQDKVDDLSQIKEAIIRLTLLQEEQAKFSEEVSETLKNMNTDIKDTKEQVGKLEDKIEKIDNKSKIDLLELVKQYAVPVIMGGGIVYFILKVTGMI
jgi:predicted nuclease with TOPRIM domain